MAKHPPQCHKCGKAHWHFVNCDKVEEHRAASARKGRAFQEVSTPEGMKPWGNVVENFNASGNNLWSKQDSLPGNATTLPQDEPYFPPEAA